MIALFCGNGTLLIQCAEAFRQQGGTIAGVVTGDPRLREWAAENRLRICGTPEAPETAGMAFDYLFSVANVTVLPMSLIGQARIAAINFHDGPLPSHAGLNVPVWALIEGQHAHAVTWHEMVEKIDAGRVFRTRSFEILPTDTAFSLNASCYDAGLQTFRELLGDIATGNLTGGVPVGERGWYARAKRPDALGFVDFTKPAAELCRLVRALNFGGYANPVSEPKIWTGKQALVARRLEIGEVSDVPAGRITAIGDDSVTIAAGDRLVTLTGITDLAGNASQTGLAPGVALPGIPAMNAETLLAIGKAEPKWEEVLADATAAVPPYPRAHRDAGGVEVAGLNTALAPDVLAAAFASWLAGLTGQQRITIGIRRPVDHPGLATVAPISLETANRTAGEIVTEITQAMADAVARPAMAADLVHRIPDADSRRRALASLAVVISNSGTDEEALGAADVVLITDRPRIVARNGTYETGAMNAMAAAFADYAARFAAAAGMQVADITLAADRDSRSGEDFDALRIDQAFAGSAARHPDRLALEAGTVKLTYAELDRRSDALARALVARGAGQGKIVGICHERNADLVIAMLAILKSGAAYLPLDPAYPADRIAYMIEDSGAPIIVASHQAVARQGLDPSKVMFPDATGDAALPANAAVTDLAYLIYTSGSTGKPKGVMVPHRAVANFFAGMDEAVPLADEARLLAVTSVSFDISVLELFWTLTRGATLVLQTDGAGESRLPDFSLFYFASEAAGTGHHAYRLLLEGAKFADENGFSAIWTPERHFHAFGGLYPNPAITAAAVAGITKNIRLRAGSSVVALHHPVRVAEDWALVDNLSNGRAGIAIASGWQPNDFVFRPDNFAKRKDVMLETVQTIRKLWRGEPMTFPGHDGKDVPVEIHPKPMQAELPLWLTAAGNPETFAAAAKLGCGVLTHLLGQTFEEVAEKIKAYRVAWREAGHPGTGHVVLMLHTFVGQDEEVVRETARGPMKGYLKSAVDLVKRASWTFPTIVQRADAAGMSPQEMFEKEELSAEDLDQLLDHAFERYYRTSGLFGTPDTAKEIVRRVAEMGVDEIGCLIDFGINTDVVLENLPNIKALMVALEQEGGVGRKASVAEEIVEKDITHLQCTPSMATFLAADGPGRIALGKLDALMVGGEAFPPELARSIRAAMQGSLLNMYGPTETTIWSSVARLDQVGDKVPLGGPITNTALSVRSAGGQALPDLVEGELWIGGDGVTDGYWHRPELTAERFVTTPEGRFYRTGDLVRRRPDGAMEFLGRIDNQVKIRGHRIELGEIEAALAALPGVKTAVVKAVEFGAGDTRLVGYVTSTGASQRPDAATLREQLAAELPEIMVPSQIVLLDRMPQTPNGKIDRKALPSPDAVADRGPMVAAGDDTEATIAAVWCEALGLKEVSVTDNFFDLGGHSLLVVQVQRRLKEKLGRDIAITDVFRFSTVRAMATHLNGSAGDEPSAANRGAARAAARLARMGRR